MDVCWKKLTFLAFSGLVGLLVLRTFCPTDRKGATNHCRLSMKSLVGRVQGSSDNNGSGSTGPEKTLSITLQGFGLSAQGTKIDCND